MSSKSVEVQEVRVPIEAIRQLTPEQRYAYYLLGLIHNESMMLRKLISFSLPLSRDQRRFKRGPEMAQTLFLFRVGCCKLWEARLKLNSPEVRDVLVNDVYPAWPLGVDELRSLNKMMAAAGWLRGLRNQVGFHYPDFDQWLPFTTPDEKWIDDSIYAGDEPGNQFFDGPDAIVRHQMFSAAKGSSPADQIGTWVEQAVELLVKLSDFTERAVWYFAMERLLEGRAVPTPVGKVLARPLDEVEIPFWTRRATGRKMRASGGM